MFSQRIVILFFILFSSSSEGIFAQQQNDLAEYVSTLKKDKAGPLLLTGNLSVGSDFLYAQEYFEAKNYSAAANGFRALVTRDQENAFANYQYAISLMKQNDLNKSREAEQYLEKAFSINPSLKKIYELEEVAVVKPIVAPKPEKIAVVEPTVNPKINIGLDKYIDDLKYSKATGGKDTYMSSPGLDAMYAIEYFEKSDYILAETNFFLSLQKDPENAYVNYLMAVSMAAQGKTEEAKKYSEKAFATDANLNASYAKDVATATAKFKKIKASQALPKYPVSVSKKGGTLVYGNYTCTNNVYNGPGKSPAYTPVPKGDFDLNSNGTYTWASGQIGKYKYDRNTGVVTWLSGYFKSADAKLSTYQTLTNYGQITVNFSESYRLECGCKK